MQTSRGNIVVVEDDDGLNRALARLLETAGFEPKLFSSAEGLLASAAKDCADCFVVDIHLPGLSGFELRARLRGAGVLRPFIFMTAHDDREIPDLVGSLERCIRKPFTRQSLLQAIDAALLAGGTDTIVCPDY